METVQQQYDPILFPSLRRRGASCRRLLPLVASNILDIHTTVTEQQCVVCDISILTELFLLLLCRWRQQKVEGQEAPAEKCWLPQIRATSVRGILQEIHPLRTHKHTPSWILLDENSIYRYYRGKLFCRFPFTSATPPQRTPLIPLSSYRLRHHSIHKISPVCSCTLETTPPIDGKAPAIYLVALISIFP